MGDQESVSRGVSCSRPCRDLPLPVCHLSRSTGLPPCSSPFDARGGDLRLDPGSPNLGAAPDVPGTAPTPPCSGLPALSRARSGSDVSSLLGFPWACFPWSPGAGGSATTRPTAETDPSVDPDSDPKMDDSFPASLRLPSGLLPTFWLGYGGGLFVPSVTMRGVDTTPSLIRVMRLREGSVHHRGVPRPVQAPIRPHRIFREQRR